VLELSWHPDVLTPERFELVILHEDRDIVVVDKPAGQLSQGSELGDVGSLMHALMRRFGHDVRLMHRLDKGASGIMLAARHAEATAALTPQFREHTIERRYLALTAGVPPEGACEVPIVKEGRRVRAARDGEGGGLFARSVVHVLERVETPAGPGARVAVELYTGRTHQIRIHLSALGAPIFGDDEYGGPPSGRMCLHATTLGFVHPRGQRERFERDPPDDFASIAARGI
jgi:RluA family pseudouridine synthase